MKILGITGREDHFVIDISGNQRRFHYLWLRDNCPGSRTDNGQRLHESNQIDPGVRPASVSYDQRQLNIVWNDKFESLYPVEFLSTWAYDTASEPTSNMSLWDGRAGKTVVRYDYETVRADPAARMNWLSDVEKYGFSLLRNVPPVAAKIFDVVDIFGYVRETNYGRLFEVRAEEKPTNLAYTPVPLSVHTDNPYRDPCPTLQLLHCLVQAEEGGITAIVDGFNAAERLQQQDPESFALLTENEVLFRYQSEGAIVENTDRVISLDAAGKPRRIRMNNRSLAPLRLAFDRVLPYYKALFTFRSILEAESMQCRLRLESGDLIVLDNERVLHGRVCESIGERRLQGCYADRDGLLSTLRILENHGD